MSDAPQPSPQAPSSPSGAAPAPTSFVGRLDASLSRAVNHPSAPHQLWHIIQLVFIAAQRGHIARMAAALSYRTIFGIIPVIVVGISVYANFAPNQAGSAVRKLLDFTNITAIQVDDEAAFFEEPAPEPVPPTEAPTAVSAEASADLELATDSASPSTAPSVPPIKPKLTLAEKQKLDVWIEELVNRAKTIQFGAISIVGLATLIYAALSMLVEMEKTFNNIYVAPVGRSWTRRVPLYWTLITLGTFGLIASFGVQTWIVDLIKSFQWIQNSAFAKIVTETSGFCLTVAISTILLFVIYATVPNTRVKPSAALLGAFIGATLWEAGKWAFAKYVGYSLNYARLYGSIAILPLFLLWIYTTWMIILSGLQIAHSVQTYSLAKAEGLSHSVLATLGLVQTPSPRPRNTVVDSTAILAVASAVGDAFSRGRTADHTQIAESTRIDERVVAEMLERLQAAGLLHRLSSGEREGTYTLARPPESIPLSEILFIGDSLAGFESHRLPGLVTELVTARTSLIQGRTLVDLLKGPSRNANSPPGPTASPSASSEPPTAPVPDRFRTSRA